MSANVFSGSRNVAIVGSYLSGKTTLLESLLYVTGSLSRKGKIAEKNTVGDGSQEARDRQMTVEVNAASIEQDGIRFNFLDCPGSVEFTQETCNALMGVDAAIIVCEPDIPKVLTLAPLFQFLDNWEIPHLLFINKMDRAHDSFPTIIEALKSVSSRPFVLHQVPIGLGENLKGYIDLVTEKAYQYHADAPADSIPLPDELKDDEQVARAEFLEQLADFDDHLLEELLEDIEPPQDEIERDLKLELGADQIVPVFVGVAEQEFGVRPLFEALKREAPEPETTAERRGVDAADDQPIAQVLKTYYSPQGGKLSLVRIWSGALTDGMSLNNIRMGGMYRLTGQQQESLNTAIAGDIIALARMDEAATGDTLSLDAEMRELMPKAQGLSPVYALAIAPKDRKDEVKLTTALTKLLEEDPALFWEQHGDTHEVILWGQGDIHLQVALDRLERKYKLPMSTHAPQVPYKETIRKGVTKIHGRYKHQTGGHGQFGDVYLDIQPLPRGDGFTFNEHIVGGVVPRQYIPGVETGVREYLVHGPLGFPVVDVAVTLQDGSYHSVDSSEQAFKMAARIAMQEGMQKAGPQLLEPILSVTISVPNDATSKVLRLVSGRRGQVMGYDAKAKWQGWDEVQALLPQAEIQDLILELRSLTMGVGFFEWQFDHLQEVPGKIAERLLARAGNSES